MAETAEKIYARSLFEVVSEEKDLDKTFAGLAEVEQAFLQNPDYVKLLASPAISKAHKQAAIDEVFASVLPPTLINFLKVLVQNGRITLLSPIRKEFNALYDQEKGILAVTVVTAVELTDPLRQKLCQKLASVTGKEIRLTEQVDPSVLGGVLLRYQNKEMDGTLRERLDKLRVGLDKMLV